MQPDLRFRETTSAPKRPRPAAAQQPSSASLPDAPVRVIAGHAGSGKSEFAVSLALSEASAGRLVALADLDVVNPYFRSREQADVLEASGIRVISSSLGHGAALEFPAISPAVRAPLADLGCEVILDLGGDATGARLLAQFVGDVRRRTHELLVVINAYRPETATLDGVLSHVAAIEAVTGLKASGLISNTHWLRETTVDDLRAGISLCCAVSAASGIGVAFVCGILSALTELKESDLAACRVLSRPGTPVEAGWATASGRSAAEPRPRLLPIGMHLRNDWM